MTTPTVQQTIKRRIWKDKLTPTDSTTLLQIIDQASTAFKPYYTKLSSKQELVDDIISIVAVFLSRLNGL